MITTPVRIFLVGLPGSGKSHTARWLGRELGLEPIDLDREIEKAEGKTIPEIFRESGESHFRHLESDRLNAWLAGDSSYIMATGGGTPCFHGNMDAMNAAGLTVFLDVAHEIIAARLSGPTSRPLLDGFADVRERIATLDAARRSEYEKSALVVDSEMNPDELLGRVRAALRDRPL